MKMIKEYSVLTLGLLLPSAFCTMFAQTQNVWKSLSEVSYKISEDHIRELLRFPSLG